MQVHKRRQTGVVVARAYVKQKEGFPTGFRVEGSEIPTSAVKPPGLKHSRRRKSHPITPY